MRILRDEDGAVTIEFVLWLPFFLLIIAMVVDLTFIFMGHATMSDATADAARCWAVKSCTVTEAIARVQAEGQFAGVVPVVNPSFTNGAVQLDASMDIGELTVLGFFDWGDSVSTRVVQLQEGF